MRQQIRNLLKKTILRDEYSINQKLLNIIMSGSFCACIVAAILSVVLGFGMVTFAFTISILGIILLCIFITNRFRLFTLASVFLVITVNDVCFPILYFTSDGFNSGMPLWFCLGLVVTICLLRGTVCLVVFIINILGIGGAFVVGYLHPEFFTKMPSVLDATMDVGIALLFVTATIGGIYKFETYLYEKQKNEILDIVSKFEQANRVKTEFLSNVSHDIRTPMNAIVCYSEIARANSDDRKRLMDCFNKIGIASNQLLDLINGILDMSALENGRIALIENDNSIQSIIEEVKSLVEEDVKKKNLTIAMDMEQIWEDSILCDKSKLSQILLNVLKNSIQYSFDGGTIYVSVSQAEIDDVQGIVPTTIKIRDEGCGISPEFLKKIFDPFERERTNGKSEVSGIGLGLSICKRLVEMMRGTISIESEVSRGTEVTIKVPFIIQTLTEISENLDTDKIDLTGKRILIVEDNSLNREIARDILESYGCLVEEARDGTFAIDMVNNTGIGYYDMILMDIQMPLMDGYEATRIIRSFQNEQQSSIPIVALSANSFPEDKRRALECGMNGFVSKPISVEKLKMVLYLLLQEKSGKEFFHD